MECPHCGKEVEVKISKIKEAKIRGDPTANIQW